MVNIKTFNMKLILISVFLISLTACNNAKDKTSSGKEEKPAAAQSLVFDKIVGTWQSEDGKSFERWIKNTDGTYTTGGYSLKGTDTSWNEQGKVYPENGNWVFENTVKGQNEGKAVRFVSGILTENMVQFSNPAHDFPTDINYTIADANTLRAFIVGPNEKGGKDTIPFGFTRKQ